MEKNYIWQGEYGKRSHLKASFKELLKEQDSSSLEMLAIFVNNNPYNFEFYIAVVYDIPKEEHGLNSILWDEHRAYHCHRPGYRYFGYYQRAGFP